MAGEVDGGGDEGGKRIPKPEGEHSVVEIRPVFEAEDFGEELTPELRERERGIERQLRAQTEEGA